MELKEIDKLSDMVDVTELAALSEHGLQVVEEMGKVLEAVYPARSLHNIDFRELVDVHKLTHGQPFWTLWMRCSATHHMIFEAVVRALILNTMS